METPSFNADNQNEKRRRVTAVEKACGYQTYQHLITEAIMSSPGKKMTLKQSIKKSLKAYMIGILSLQLDRRKCSIFCSKERHWRGKKLAGKKSKFLEQKIFCQSNFIK